MSGQNQSAIRLRVLMGLACLLALWIVWDVQHRSMQSVMSAVNKPATQPTSGIDPEQAEQPPSNRFLLSPRLEEKISLELTDLFRPHSWVMFKKPVEIDVIEPPKPTAPPIPYAFFGRMRGVDGRVMTYLKRDDDLIAVTVGQTLHAQYKVEAVTATEVVLTYMPLTERQWPLGQVDQ